MCEYVYSIIETYYALKKSVPILISIFSIMLSAQNAHSEIKYLHEKEVNDCIELLYNNETGLSQKHSLNK